MPGGEKVFNGCLKAGEVRGSWISQGMLLQMVRTATVKNVIKYEKCDKNINVRSCGKEEEDNLIFEWLLKILVYQA